MQNTRKNPRGNSVKDLAEAFSDLKKLLKKCESMDPNPQRYSWYIIYLQANLGWQKEKQTITDIFLKRVGPPQEEPQAGPSGGAPEEGTVIIRDYSSMCDIALNSF